MLRRPGQAGLSFSLRHVLSAELTVAILAWGVGK